MASTSHCEDTERSFICKCKPGFEGNGTLCADVDECSTGTHYCGHKSKCTNSEGSYSCSCKNGVGEVCKPNWVLVLNDYSEKNVPFLIDTRGRSKEIGFEYGHRAEVSGSCPIVWRGKMYMFGGMVNIRQISVVDNCKLELIGRLQFKMENGACAQRNDTEIFICFEYPSKWATHRTCRRAIGPLEEFLNFPNSTFPRAHSRIATTSGKLKLFGQAQLTLVQIISLLLVAMI